MVQFPPTHNTPGIPELTDEEKSEVEKARTALQTIRKTFEFWIDIARGLDALKQKADQIEGFKAGYAFAVLREREGLGENVLNKTRISKLGKVLANLGAIQKWRETLTEKERMEWSSPEAICQRFPDFVLERKKKKAEKGISQMESDAEQPTQEGNDEDQSEEGEDQSSHQDNPYAFVLGIPSMSVSEAFDTLWRAFLSFISANFPDGLKQQAVQEKYAELTKIFFDFKNIVETTKPAPSWLARRRVKQISKSSFSDWEKKNVA